MTSDTALSGELRRAHEALKIAQLTIEKMKVELAYLRRMKYGRSSEKLEHAQLELVGGRVAQPEVDPRADAGEDDGLKSNVTSLDAQRKKREPRTRPGLRELPAHLPRRTVVHTPQGGCGCRACGGGLREIGQDVSEVLDYEPGTFHVVRHVRPKLACAGCHTITQALAPTRPTDRCMAGAGLLTHIAVSKFSDHVPLYRLGQIYARDGVEMSRSTITDMMANCASMLTPLAEAVGRYVLRAAKVHGDDTPIRATEAFCRPMRTPDTTRSTRRVASWRPGAGATRGASCGTSMSDSSACPGRWRIRVWCAWASCSGSKPR